MSHCSFIVKAIMPFQKSEHNAAQRAHGNIYIRGLGCVVRHSTWSKNRQELFVISGIGTGAQRHRGGYKWAAFSVLRYTCCYFDPFHCWHPEKVQLEWRQRGSPSMHYATLAKRNKVIPLEWFKTQWIFILHRVHDLLNICYTTFDLKYPDILILP